MKHIKLAFRIIILIAAVLIVSAFAIPVIHGWIGRHTGPTPPPRGVPVVFRTPGGLLEVGGVKFTEDFFKQDSKTWWGVYLGTTVSQIQVPVTYRYHIELLKDWTVHVNGNVCTVNAPAIAPTLPVAFDSTQMTKKTESGWARFNKDENLRNLELSITPIMNVRAGSPQYINQVREAARKTVAEFIQGWLLRDGVAGWKSDSDHVVRVIFPGEEEEGLTHPQIKMQNL